MEKVKAGRYRHFKGPEYEVLGVARHSETLDEFVIYRQLIDHSRFGRQPLWIRPKKMFLETVERDGKKVPRFSYLGKD
jgi:hypothetical protein